MARSEIKIIKRSAFVGGEWREVRTFKGLARGTPISYGYITAHGATGWRFTKVK